MNELDFEIAVREPDVIEPSLSAAPGISPVLEIDLADLRLNDRYRVRAEQDQATIEAYAQAMRNGAEFPPIYVYFTGSDDYVVDGWHRYEAAKLASLAAMPAVRIVGGLEALYRVQAEANAQHGRRRTNADKRRVISLLLADEDHVTQSDRGLAQLASVDHKTVSSVRREMEKRGDIEPQATRRSRDHRDMPVHPRHGQVPGEDVIVSESTENDDEAESLVSRVHDLRDDPLVAATRLLSRIDTVITNLEGHIGRVLNRDVAITTRDLLWDRLENAGVGLREIQAMFPQREQSEVAS